jgi:TusA-related sulfurtransferase
VTASPPIPDTWIDERGRRCPLPVLALSRACQANEPGRVIAVLADDPAARYDIPAWCRLKSAAYLGDIDPPDGGIGRAYLVRVPG